VIYLRILGSIVPHDGVKEFSPVGLLHLIVVLGLPAVTAMTKNAFMTQPQENSRANSGRVHKFLTSDLTVRASSVIATRVVDEMRSIQNSYPLATVAVGRSMVGALLMASHLKNTPELSLYFQGNGPLGRVFAEANYEGQVRGYCNNPQYIAPIEGGQIQIGQAIGIGLLTVTHHLSVGAEPHRGTVIIRSGEVGDDIAFYLEQSHQIPSVVALGVHLSQYGLVEAAGGILIELMPGHDEETVAKIENRVKEAPSISKRILEGASAEDLIRYYLSDFELMELEHPYPIQYHCRCTYERVLRSMVLLGADDLGELIDEKKPVDVACEFCGRHYQVLEEDLVKLRQEAYKGSLN
jgi:molecular chaperone Hsp33